MRTALLIGINDYSFGPLKGCINDANNMAAVLNRHENGDLNFNCKVYTSDKREISRIFLRDKTHALFRSHSEAALFYFSGHGVESKLGGFLATQDAKKWDEGVNFGELISLANQSSIKEIIIILDCCHSGHLGNAPADLGEGMALLREGVSILTSSAGNEYSVEKGGAGLFTQIILEGFRGGAADIRGRITVADLYSYADQLLGPWDQRPIFKSHVSKMISIRNTQARVSKDDLKTLGRLFENKDAVFPLNPTFEFSSPSANKENADILQKLQLMAKVGLIQPVGETHMYFAAMNSKGCKMTEQGKFYWKMVKEGKL